MRNGKKDLEVRMSTRRPRTSRKTRWTRERSCSRARVRYTCTSLRRLCGVVSHASKFFDSRRREEVTFSGCGPLALSLSHRLSLQRKTHSNRKNGAKSCATCPDPTATPPAKPRRASTAFTALACASYGVQAKRLSSRRKSGLKSGCGRAERPGAGDRDRA